MLEQLVTPEIVILAGALACALAVLTLVLAGRSAFVQGLASRLATIETQITERKKILSDVGQKLAEYEELDKKVERLEKWLAALQGEIKPIEEKHLKALSDYEDAKVKLRETREEWGQLKDKVEMYKERVAQIDALESEMKKLSEQKDQLEEIVKDLPKQKKVLDQIQKLSKKKSDEIQELHASFKKLTEEKVTAQESLDNTRKKIEESEEYIKKLKDEMRKLKNARVEINAKLETLSERLKKVGRMPPEAFESLNAPVFRVNDSMRTEPDEEKAIQSLYQLVEACGFEIPIRLQDAFHTALKTSDISCLTVMAGVSGTGKSAFPKLYAQAMGMHFLPLAVEPRWDSPHDLFGFLNYMENRFEATTLGRALVQFNNAPHALESTTSLKDQLLLVLLDEMNLARIEYYFSEFLSKLEMRRNSNITREEDYRVVSVEVFSGHESDDKGDSSPAVRLYAGTNILFVGTMNEDESTQSLSDKVIDRANVLYFGRPNKLQDKRQKMFEDTHWLPLPESVWRSWIANAGTETVPYYAQIDDLINRINRTLALLGRPFGWRTYKAMQSYIANHPAVRFREDNGLSPLADQIAMRVMPKLRGVDLSEHGEVFNNLGQLLQDIGNPALQQAFDQARQSTQGFFDWRGIDWEH